MASYKFSAGAAVQHLLSLLVLEMKERRVIFVLKSFKVYLVKIDLAKGARSSTAILNLQGHLASTTIHEKE